MIKRILNSLKNHYILYIIWTIVAVLGVYYEFHLITMAKNNEKIDILINSPTINEKYFNNIISNNKPGYLREVNYRHSDSTTNLFLQVFESYGKYEADLFILSSDAFLEINDISKKVFVNLDLTICEEYFGNNLEYYSYQDINYGIKINTPYIGDEEKDYYLLFASSSLHLAKLNNSDYDGGISFAKTLIGIK